ncbi:uncharacterized protein E0L32_008829 [Thyridium curvatum]|uniref:VWFA domain-containing protein n=1 Tax=Thyridium curvatum TaxID=1093900 RepID=A0A507AK98_9PEZI|nr:uncharacterized protein E0L32_008829 [Thyridium curvatum]TPX09982.1 hypothetical protein E0L32_008829 [Thyridium curvatum]
MHSFSTTTTTTCPRTQTAMSTKRSVFGSIKDRLSKKSFEMGSPKSSSPIPLGRAAPSPTSASPSRGRSPLTNLSPATRRPRQEPPPPSYNEAINTPVVQPPQARDVSPSPSALSIGSLSITTPEDPYAFLSSFDTIFLIDDSGSMAGRSWREVKDVLLNIAPICTAHDTDGVDVYFLNHTGNSPADLANGKAAGGYRNITDEQTIEDLFRRVAPTRATLTGTALSHILGAYIRNYEARVAACGGDPDGTGVRPINVIVITDGAPTDDPEAVLRRWAGKLDKLDAPPHQVGIQFFQVGNEPGATEALRQLDDELAQAGNGRPAVRDMVDTVTWNARDGARRVLTADAILKTVLGAVVKRLDRSTVSAEEQRSNNLLSVR